MSRTAVPAKPRSAKSDSAAARIRSFVETSASAMATPATSQTNLRFFRFYQSSPRKARRARGFPPLHQYFPLFSRGLQRWSGWKEAAGGWGTGSGPLWGVGVAAARVQIQPTEEPGAPGCGGRCRAPYRGALARRRGQPALDDA